MIRALTAYLATAVTMLIMDFCWLTAMGGFYKSQLGPLMKTPPNLAAAAAFYLVYVAGVTAFVVLPSLQRAGARVGAKGGWPRASLFGGGFGLVAYATYDLTNLSTLSGFSLTLTVTDLAWGMVITAASATVGYLAARRVG